MPGGIVKSITLENGRCFSFMDVGANAPLVILHGIGSSSGSFRSQLEGLSASHRVVAWDAPGYGGSSPLNGDEPSSADYAVALSHFVDGLALPRFHLLGHSLGCLIAASFARTSPERVLSLSLCSIATGHGRLDADQRGKFLQSRLMDLGELGARGMAEKRGPRLLGPDASPEMIRLVIDTMAAVNPSGYAQAARMLSNADVRADITKLHEDMPIQIIFGDHDLITPPAENMEVAELLPAANVYAIRGAGHAVYLERAQEFNRIVIDFIERISVGDW